jgi:hypothetical protein
LNSTNKRGRGRPKSETTLQRERIAKLLSEKPNFLPQSESTLMRKIRQASSRNKVIKKQIFLDYKYDATVPVSHALSMASLGDELLFGHEHKIIDQDKSHIQRVAKQRKLGTKETKKKSKLRAEAVINKNKILLQNMLVDRGKSLSSVVKKICSEWKEVTIAQRILNEPITLINRGDGESMPTERTIRNWIKKYYLFKK